MFAVIFYQEIIRIEIKTNSVGGLKSTLFSGEGLVSQITNKGIKPMRIFLESRSKIAYIKYIKDCDVIETFFCKNPLNIIVTQGLIAGLARICSKNDNTVTIFLECDRNYLLSFCLLN